MKYKIEIKPDSSTNSFSVSVKDWETVIISRSNLKLANGIPLIRLNPFAALFLYDLENSFETEVPEHIALAVIGDLEHKSFSSSLTPFDQPLPNLFDYSELVLKGAELTAKVLDGDTAKDLKQRYRQSEEAFQVWRSEILAGGCPSQPDIQTPWRLIIYRPSEEFGSYTVEIHLDSHLVQSGEIETILPLMQTLCIDCEHFENDWSSTIEIPVPQHRALLLVYFIEHAKRISSSDCPTDWGETSDLMYESLQQQSPLHVFREALRITDGVLGTDSYGYMFAPYNYGLCDFLSTQVANHFDLQGTAKKPYIKRAQA